uniref:Uncharacterized protein n=1 Tax=Nicotiana tabacum TaxID=4097 RepID=A0A1S4CE90_TOBAC
RETVPADKRKAYSLRKKAARYCLHQENLYRKIFGGPLARCLRPSQTEYVMREVYEGHCGSHAGGRSLVKTLIRAGYYWPKMEEEANGFVSNLSRRIIFLSGLSPDSLTTNSVAVIERFEELEGRNPGETSADDLPNVQKLRKELCEAHCLNESQIPDSLLQRLIASRSEFPPVCAIIGGILGQEVIKAISGKGDPLKNFFFFDAMDGKGIIEDISNVNS